MDYGFRNGSLRQVVPVVSCGGVPRFSRHSLSRFSQVVADGFVVSTCINWFPCELSLSGCVFLPIPGCDGVSQLSPSVASEVQLSWAGWVPLFDLD